MAAPRGSLALVLAAALDVVAAAALFLPWWRAARAPVLLVDGPTRPLGPDTWAGWEITGPLRATLLVGLVVAAAVAAVVARVRSGGFGAAGVRPTRWRGVLRVLVVAAGVAPAVVGVTVLTRWGVTGAPGAWLAVLAGAGGAALAVPTVSHRGASAALIVALTVVLLPGPPPRPDPVRADGPFLRLGALGADRFRAGTPGLAADPATSRLVLVDGAPAAATVDGLARLDADGRAEVLARSVGAERVGDGQQTAGRDGPRSAPLGVAGDRVARLIDEDTVLVAGLRAGDPTAVIVRDVSGAGPVGPDGRLWLTSPTDPDGTIRYLDLADYDGEQDLDATFLPVVTIGSAPATPTGFTPLEPQDLLPGPDGAVRVVTRTGGDRIERVTSSPGGADVTVLAGGPDPACGLTRTARAAYLATLGRLTIGDAGAVWFTVTGTDGSGRLVRLDGDVLRAVPHPLPGPVDALVAAPDGSLTMIVRDADGPALWRLSDASAALADLPPTPECVVAPAPVGPPVTLVPVANVSGEALGVPLGADGRFARGGRGAVTGITVVTPDRREIPLGVRRDAVGGAVVPDGTGGAWWAELPGDGEVVLAHGRAGRPEERLAPVALPPSREGTRLLVDLGGRAPLLGTVTGAYRVADGTAVPVVEGRVTGGAVRADGRGWVLADGRLVAIEGDRVLGAVIDAGDRRGDADTPVEVQLATGVAPGRLALPDASLALDAAGRAVVVSGGVVLAVDDAGTVTVVAQDARLESVSAVEGGIATVLGRTVARVEPPG